MKKLSLLVLTCLATACATGYNPDYYYNAIQVVNLTGSTITEVKLQVGAPGKTLSCNEVAKNRLCEERFGKRRYPRQAIELSWLHSDGSRRSQLMTPHIAAFFTVGLPLRLTLEINPDASVEQYFEQDEPDGPIMEGKLLPGSSAYGIELASR